MRDRGGEAKPVYPCLKAQWKGLNFVKEKKWVEINEKFTQNQIIQHKKYLTY